MDDEFDYLFLSLLCVSAVYYYRNAAGGFFHDMITAFNDFKL